MGVGFCLIFVAHIRLVAESVAVHLCTEMNRGSQVNLVRGLVAILFVGGWREVYE